MSLALAAVVSISLVLLLSTLLVEQAQATGGGKDVAGLVIPMLEDAIKQLDANNTQTAKSILEDSRNELIDTYEQEVEEED